MLAMGRLLDVIGAVRDGRPDLPADTPRHRKAVAGRWQAKQAVATTALAEIERTCAGFAAKRAAALHVFAAENEARMQAMAAAHEQAARQLADLRALQRRVRQEEITALIIEISTGEAASRAPIKPPSV